MAWVEKAVRINPFFRCGVCGKIHTVTHISATTKCKCGVLIYDPAWKR